MELRKRFLIGLHTDGHIYSGGGGRGGGAYTWKTFWVNGNQVFIVKVPVKQKFLLNFVKGFLKL